MRNGVSCNKSNETFKVGNRIILKKSDYPMEIVSVNKNSYTVEPVNKNIKAKFNIKEDDIFCRKEQ